MFWNKTLTIYNKHEDENGLITWYRHRIQNCFYKTTRTNNTIGNMQVLIENNIVRIPAQNNFLTAHEWNLLSPDKRGKFLTLQAGDLIILGGILDEIDEYCNEKRSSDLIAKYKTLGSMFVDSVNINDFMLGAHYLVRGK